MRTLCSGARAARTIALVAGLAVVANSMADGDAPDVPLRDAFTKESWYAPKAPPRLKAAVPAPQVIAAPPPPVAPPLPFSFMGRYAESDQAVFFLTAGERLLVVHAGEVIDGTYRVEGVVGDKLDITYLPLGIRQSLDLGQSAAERNQAGAGPFPDDLVMPDN